MTHSTTRNRNMAIKALSEWGKANWPATMPAALEQARDHEPDVDVRRRIENVIEIIQGGFVHNDTTPDRLDV